MAPQQHLEWFEENIAWFEAAAPERLAEPVPTCPGWTVLDVVNHLSLGLGLAYPVAMSKAPETADEVAFDGVRWPAAIPGLRDAVAGFSENMRGCLQTFRQTDPDTPCWTYAGPGAASFWFRRAAIETAMHRMDVEDAIGGSDPLLPERAADAVIEAADFALPLAAEWSSRPEGTLSVSTPQLAEPVAVGDGPPTATVSGPTESVLRALWGRDDGEVSISGDREVARAWLSVVEAGFAGR